MEKKVRKRGEKRKVRENETKGEGRGRGEKGKGWATIGIHNKTLENVRV